MLLTALPLLVQKKPLRIGVAGLTHTHGHWIPGREVRGDIEIVEIVEPDKALVQRYTAQHGLPMSLLYNSLDEMIAAARPEAVAAFGTIYAHLGVGKPVPRKEFT